MIKPSLSKNLLGIFSAFVLIESMLIGVLCFDVMAMNDAARKELEAVELSQQISETMHIFISALDALADLRDDPGNQEIMDRARVRREKFYEVIKPQVEKMQAMGFDPGALDKLRDSTAKVFGLWNQRGKGKASKRRVKGERTESLLKCVNQFALQLRFAQKMSTKVQRPLLGIEPEQILHLTALVNVLYLIFAVAFVERSISRPLSRLTDDCENIRKRLPLAPSKRMQSEIGVLQDSFQLMARQVVENENRRKSYLGLLQTVQLSSLSKAYENLLQLSASSSLLEKASARLKKTLTNMNSLSALLKSMAEQLESDEEKKSLNLSQCSIKELLQQAQDSVESLVQSRSIKLEIESHEDLSFRADSEKISRVILNLLSNAIKYSPDGAVVGVSVTSSSSALKVAIKDAGPGISEQGQERLFKRFSQVEAVDGIQRAGTGLGLVICKEFVEAHHGEIGCISAPGQGSTFWFSLPLNGELGSGSVLVAEAPSARVQPLQSGSLLVRGLEKGRLKSIKAELSLLLLLFVLVQGYLIFDLNRLFGESAARNVRYQTKKSQMLAMEEFMITFVRWGARMQIAGLKMDFAAADVLYPKLESERKKLLEFNKQFEKDSETYKRIEDIAEQEALLLKQMDYIKENVSEVIANMNEMKDAMELPVHRVETYWKAILAAEREGFKATYDFSEQVRTKILILLVLAGVADLLLIGSAAYVGLKLAGRILVLKSKAESFGAGKRISYSLVGKDELSFLDERLCQVAGEIRDAEAKRQELLAVINHDLRTPLSSIIGTMENLRQGAFGPLETVDAELVERSMYELESLLLQINDLLLLEKVESNAYEPNRLDCQVRDILDKSITQLSFMSLGKDLHVVVEFVAGTGDLSIMTDRELLGRSLIAVLKNAIAASATGSEIRLTVRKSADEVLFEVSNSGPPIDAQLLPQIFERFRFVDGKPVSGLGLPLAFQSLRLLSGSINISSESGTTIARISLPNSIQL